MTSRNDITGDLIKTKPTMGKEFEAQFERIFGIKESRAKYIPPALPNDLLDNSELLNVDVFLNDKNYK